MIPEAGPLQRIIGLHCEQLLETTISMPGSPCIPMISSNKCSPWRKCRLMLWLNVTFNPDARTFSDKHGSWGQVPVKFDGTIVYNSLQPWLPLEYTIISATTMKMHCRRWPLTNIVAIFQSIPLYTCPEGLVWTLECKLQRRFTGLYKIVLCQLSVEK